MNALARPIVVKLGGSLLADAEARRAVCAEVARRHVQGEPVVLVHGGGTKIDAQLAALGIPKRVEAGLRVTDEATLDVVVAVLAGLVNKRLVAELSALGAPAAGISGADGGLLRARPHPPVGEVDLGWVGSVAASDARVLLALLRAGMLPVVAPVASGPGATLWNVNADAAAAAIAASLAARRLVFLTDVEGVRDEAGRLLPRLDAGGIRTLLAGSAVTGGMRPKLSACLCAAEAGVPEIVIAGPARHGAALAGGEGGTRYAAH